MRPSHILAAFTLLSTLAPSTRAGDGVVDLTSLANYANQTIPAYITRDNAGANLVTDQGATLGRVLFYDERLSRNDTSACVSCHQQSRAFSDTTTASTGVAGTTGHHAMRLVNTRFAQEVRFFWDERATSLEDQTTRPIRDHGEMGFSGASGDPDFAARRISPGPHPICRTGPAWPQSPPMPVDCASRSSPSAAPVSTAAPSTHRLPELSGSRAN